MFKSIGSLAVYVSDMARAKKFYTEILGFEISADLEPNLCFLKSKSGKIYIYLEGGKKTASIDNETCRLSFFLEAEKTAAETYAFLKKAGVSLLQSAPESVADDTACFQFQDPDGNIIEVSAQP
jgi:predicted enzyme related to lactoylglutathione lyase